MLAGKPPEHSPPTVRRTYSTAPDLIIMKNIKYCVVPLTCMSHISFWPENDGLNVTNYGVLPTSTIYVFTFDTQKVEWTFSGDGLGQEGFADTGRSVPEKKKITILKFQARKILKWIQYTTILNLSLITVDLKKSEKKTANLQLARFFGKELKLNSKYTKPYSLET